MTTSEKIRNLQTLAAIALVDGFPAAHRSLIDAAKAFARGEHPSRPVAVAPWLAALERGRKPC